MMICLDALGGQLVAELSNGEGTFRVLCTGHRHYFVVEQLVGDVHACGDACLDSQLTGVEEGAVADVLEQVRHVGERCLPDPLAALAAHLRQAGDSAVLTAGHGDECVATDSAAADGTLGDSGGTVVGAPAAEVRGSLGGKHVERQRGREGALELGRAASVRGATGRAAGLRSVHHWQA